MDTTAGRAKSGAPRRGWTPLFFTALILSLVFPVLAAVPARAAETGLTGQGAGFSSFLYDNSNGLPTSEANDVVQSGEGFIWIGCYCGLVRYDGNRFRLYDASTGVASVNTLFVDGKDRLWIGTNEGGLALRSGDSFVFYGEEDGLPSLSVHALTEDGDGNIYVGTGAGVARIDGDGVLRRIDEPRLNGRSVKDLCPGGDGNIYGLTGDGEVFTIKNGALTSFRTGEEIGLTGISAIFPDPEKPGYVYLGTGGGTVVRGDFASGMKESGSYSTLPQTGINRIRRVDDKVWICSDNGIGYFDSGFNYVEVKGLPMTYSVGRMTVDFEGNLWFTSSRQGVMKIVENRFTDVSLAAGLGKTVVNSTCKYMGDLYVGADNGLFILDGDLSPVQNDLTRQLEGARVRCVRADSAGALWICTFGKCGLVRYDGRTGETAFFDGSNGLPSDRVRSCLELSDGSLAVATNRGACVIRDGKVTSVYGAAEGLDNLQILCLEEGENGVLYLGSDGGGIYVVEDGKIGRVGTANGLSSDIVLRIKKDPVAGGFWVITSNSIAFLKGEKAKTVSRFPYSNNYDLYYDRNGNLWVLSSNGVHVVSREDMLSGSDLHCALLDRSRGLPYIPTANSYSQLDADGTLFISGTGGVCSVNIDEENGQGGQARLAVPSVTVDGVYVEVPPDGKIAVPRDCKRLVVTPFAFTYSLNAPRVGYMLEGFDEEETVVSGRELGDVVYTNLKGGTYRFRLALINELTGEKEQVKTVVIEKEMAFFEQPWFVPFLVLLAAALALGGAILYFRKKTAALEKKALENKRLIHDISGVFAECIDMKDPDTNGHSTRVAEYTSLLAGRLGYPKDEADKMYNIALLHDIGKISIPDAILNKPMRLTDEEFDLMKSHASRGFGILKKVSIAPDLALGAGYHHERYDGGGYPSGLKGDEIPKVAQIIAVADTFDAMYSKRPYRERMSIEDAAAELRRIAGSQLNPVYVDAFLQLIAEGKIGGNTGKPEKPRDPTAG